MSKEPEEPISPGYLKFVKEQIKVNKRKKKYASVEMLRIDWLEAMRTILRLSERIDTLEVLLESARDQAWGGDG